MPQNTTRLTLQEPLGIDAPSELRLAITNHATTLDNAALYTEGALASRPAVGTVEHGRQYRSTDTGTLAFSDGTNWTQLLTLGKGALATHLTAVSYAAVSGDLVLATAAPLTVTLPAVSTNAIVGVIGYALATGASPITVTTGGPTNIYGLGLNGVSSFPLGTGAASVTLQSDGTNWYVIAGQQDTGWVGLSLATNWSTNSGPITGVYPAAYKIRGDQGFLRGGIVNNTGGTAFTPTTMATLPASARPAKGILTPMYSSGTGIPYLTITTAGLVQYGDYTNAGLGNGLYTILDGVNFALTS